MNQAGTFSDRIIGVLKLIPATYREIARDTSATTQAMWVVAGVAVASAIGAADDGIGAIIGGAIGAVIAWVIFGVVSWFVGTRLLGAEDIGGGPGRMLRTSGFAQAPSALAVLGFIPVLGWIAAIVAFIWSLITGVLAAREALGVTTGKAIITIVISAILLGIVAAILGLFGLTIYAVTNN